jgi:uncharacterized protein YegJ (DUF2314 family)
MKESLGNIGLVCQHTAPTAGKYTGQDAKQFVGKFVKVAFDAAHPLTGKPSKEHMWVKVESEDQGKLTGKLDNDPVFVTELQCGDEVTLTVEQIEELIG